MVYRLLADLLLVVHTAFVAFVVAGGFLTWCWPRVAWLHLPAAAWGIAIAFGGWICPLTPLEVRLRYLGGQVGYTGSFIDHYLLPVLYPEALTRTGQLALGGVALAINVAAYAGFLLRRRARGRGRA